MNATSTVALYDLLETALDAGAEELAVRLGYWGTEDAARVETVAQLRQERGLEETPEWVVNYYPASGPVGLIEFLLAPPAEPSAPERDQPSLAEPSEGFLDGLK